PGSPASTVAPYRSRSPGTSADCPMLSASSRGRPASSGPPASTPSPPAAGQPPRSPCGLEGRFRARGDMRVPPSCLLSRRAAPASAAQENLVRVPSPRLPDNGGPLAPQVTVGGKYTRILHGPASLESLEISTAAGSPPIRTVGEASRRRRLWTASASPQHIKDHRDLRNH